MGKIAKTFAFTLILTMAISSVGLLTVKPASAQSSPVIIVTPSPTPVPTLAPTPTPTSNIALNYSEVSRTSEGVDTILVLAVTAEYNFGQAVTINFQDFTLDIAVERGGPPPIQPGSEIYEGTAKPLETGNVTLDSNSRQNSFQLTFEFSTLQDNLYGQTPFTGYELVYSGSTTTASPSPSPTPAVQELSWLVIVPLLLSVFFVAVIFRNRKNRQLEATDTYIKEKIS